MANTGYASFDATVDKTNRLLRQIEQAYGWPKDRRNQSYDARCAWSCMRCAAG